ncbi:MAG: hypothetical protein AAF637_23215 [Pseudomonadota bacterium]
MLRILITASVLLLVSATSVQADQVDETLHLEFGARVGGAQAFLQPAVRASLPSSAMHRTINGTHRAARRNGGNAVLGMFGASRETKPGFAMSVSESVSLRLRYEYLRREDVQLDAAETASLDEKYSSHHLLVRANWKF